MKILIVNNMAPFVWGGAEELAAHLEKNLILAGHEAEVVRIPFQWEPAEGIPAQMLMVDSIELENVDHVIVLKFPAYLIRHPKKTFWLLHQYRQAYELFGSEHTNIPNNDLGEEIRSIIFNADNGAFKDAKRIYTNSDVTRQRLKKYNGFDAEVLLPPLNDPELFVGGKGEGYVFAGGRVNNMKRQYLLVEAMKYTDPHVRLIVAGPPETPEDAVKLRRIIEENGLEERVKLDLRFLSREELAGYVNGANACAYLPYDEDSLGYVAMEAATAAKPIISTIDSGGVLGLVKENETGWVTEPSAQALSKVLNTACRDDDEIYKMGISARRLWDSMGITWTSTIEKLLS